MLYEKFKDLYAEHITSAFIVGPEGLPLEDFFSIDLKTLFRKRVFKSMLKKSSNGSPSGPTIKALVICSA